MSMKAPDELTQVKTAIYDDLAFWTWAASQNFGQYWAISAEHEALFDEFAKSGYQSELPSLDWWQKHREATEQIKKKIRSSRYDLILSIARLVKVTDEARSHFDVMAHVHGQIEHLNAQARYLRNLVEHELEYFMGGGKHREDWIREHPEEPLISADASSDVIINGEHWLGGRLGLNRASVEVNLIVEAFNTLTPI